MKLIYYEDLKAKKQEKKNVIQQLDRSRGKLKYFRIQPLSAPDSLKALILPLPVSMVQFFVFLPYLYFDKNCWETGSGYYKN